MPRENDEACAFVAVARVERSETREIVCVDRSIPDVAALHPGYSSAVIPGSPLARCPGMTGGEVRTRDSELGPVEPSGHSCNRRSGTIIMTDQSVIKE